MREQPAHLGDGGEVDRGILADCRMRATASLDAADPLGRQRAALRQEFGILTGIDVVRNCGDLVSAAHLFAQPIHQRRLARSDRTADPDPQRITLWPLVHERKSLVYWVS